MGIDLGPVVVRHETTLADLAGQRVAFDAWNVLYQFLSSIRSPDGTPLRDAHGRVTSHLAGTLYRTANLVEAGIQPVFVFDGPPHPLKRETLAQRSARKAKAKVEYEAALEAGDLETARSKAQQTSHMTPDMVATAQGLLRALGIPVVDAPGEGEAQAAWMVTQGQADAVCSQDFDALLFGAPRLLRNLGVGGRRKVPGKQVWVDAPPEEVRLSETLATAGLTREQLVDAALLVGTDFHPGVHGIGPRKAVDLVRADGSLEALLGRLHASGAKTAAERAVLAAGEDLSVRDEVRRIFLEPAHVPTGDLRAGRLDADAVHRIMVEEHGFSADRVATAVERFRGARARSAQQRLF